MAVGRTFPNEIDRIFNAPGGPLGKEARAVALDTARNAEVMSRVVLGRNPNDQPRTGRLARSWQVKVVGRSTEFQVINTAPYSAAIELGARPHPIVAKKTKTLRFRGRDGRWRSVKMVKHPGNPAFRILEYSAEIAVRKRYGSVQVL